MFAEYARLCVENGYSVFPIPPRSKKANLLGWNSWCETQPPRDLIETWIEQSPGHGIALACGTTIVAIDIDAEEPATADALAKLTEIFLGRTPFIRVGRAPRRAMIYAVSGPVPKRKIGTVELLGMGSYVMGFGIHPDTEHPYRWYDASPADFPLHRLPVVEPRRVEEFGRALEAFHGRANPQSAAEADVPRRSRYAPVGERVEDGRDTYLFNLALRAIAANPSNAAIAAVDAWDMFVATADLRRHKRDGKRPWRLEDARTKVRWIMKQPRSARRALPAREQAFWTDARRRNFVLAVAVAAAERRIPTSAWLVSQAMLTHIHGDGACYASIERLASLSARGIDSVKDARARLVETGLWLRGLPIGGRGTPNLYRPNPAALAVQREANLDEETVDAQYSPNMQCEIDIGRLSNPGLFKDLVLKE